MMAPLQNPGLSSHRFASLSKLSLHCLPLLSSAYLTDTAEQPDSSRPVNQAMPDSQQGLSQLEKTESIFPNDLVVGLS